MLLLLVGRMLGEGMQRLGQPALMGNCWRASCWGRRCSAGSGPRRRNSFSLRSGAERHDRRPVADRHPDAAAADRHGDRSQAGAQIRLRGGGDRALRHRLAFRLRFCAGPVRPGFAVRRQAGSGRLVPSLFLGTALSISSIKIVAMVVREMNFMRRNLGQIIVATAIMEDTVRLGDHRHHFRHRRRGRRTAGGIELAGPGQDRGRDGAVPALLLHRRTLAGVHRHPLGQ